MERQWCQRWHLKTDHDAHCAVSICLTVVGAWTAHCAHQNYMHGRSLVPVQDLPGGNLPLQVPLRLVGATLSHWCFLYIKRCCGWLVPPKWTCQCWSHLESRSVSYSLTKSHHGRRSETVRITIISSLKSLVIEPKAGGSKASRNKVIHQGL